MSVDYSATTFVGIPIRIDDWLEEYKQEIILCGCYKTAEYEYCPVCGRHKDKWAETKTLYRPKPAVAKLLSDWDPLEDSPEDLKDALDCLRDYSVTMAGSSYRDNRIPLLGFEVGHCRSPGADGSSLDNLMRNIVLFEQWLISYSIKIEPMIYTILNCY